jgi:hypothetical protein
MFPLSCRLRVFFECALLALLATSLRADTYSNWKARVFTEGEQADPTISGELALSPAGDGIPNLLKYAFAIDPHQDGSLALPKIDFVEVVDLVTGQTKKYPRITLRVSSTDYPSDLYFVPEFSSDLRTWGRGDSIFAPPSQESPANSGYPTLVSHRTLSSIDSTSSAFLRIRVLEGQTLLDDWQLGNFGHTGVDPHADPDGDGLTNFDEFLHGTDPNDYYNGKTPTLERAETDSADFHHTFCRFPLSFGSHIKDLP